MKKQQSNAAIALFMNVFIFPNSSNPFTAELERHQEMATQKWGFDFRADRPLNGNGSFIWERVSSQESNFAPQMYTLTRAAHVRSDVSEATDMDTLLMERADRENLVNSSMDSNNSDNDEYDSQNESLALGPSTSVAAFAAAAAAAASSSATSSSSNYAATQQRKRQLKITGEFREYMYVRVPFDRGSALRRSLSQRCA